MKIIFLDFNGVLDTFDNMNIINESNLNRLKTIVNETNAKVVISSSIKTNYYYTGKMSKQLEYVMSSLENVGINVVGFTKKCETREEEIRVYLEEHPDIENFCIIDDEYYMEKFSDNMVKLKPQMMGGMGLQDEDMYKALEILNRKELLKK